MKRLAILTLISTPAFGHLVPYDSKAFLDLAKGNPENANYIAHFCSLAANSVEECLERLIVAKGEDAAETCGREIHEIDIDLKKEMHLVGVLEGVPLSGHPHTDYAYSKADGWHRHGYTDGTRLTGGRIHGSFFVQQERANAVKQQETVSSGKESVGGVSGSLVGGGEKLGAKVEVGIEGKSEHTTSAGSSTVVGGLNGTQIAKAYNEGFKTAWANPWAAKVAPDIVFTKGKDSAVGSDGKTYKNDPKSDVPELPKDQLKDEGPVSVSNPKDEKIPTSGPLHPTSPTFNPPPSDKGASIDASTSTDGSWALIAPAQSGELTPIQTCYEIEMAKIKKKEMIQTVDGDELTYAQRKERAEENLSLGVCDDSFFGEEFCRDWKQKQKLHIEETLSTPSVAVEEQPFEEFATIEEPAEPLKDPFALLEGSDPFSPIPADGCVKDCPIEVQPF